MISCIENGYLRNSDSEYLEKVTEISGMWQFASVYLHKVTVDDN